MRQEGRGWCGVAVCHSLAQWRAVCGGKLTPWEGRGPGRYGTQELASPMELVFKFLLGRVVEDNGRCSAKS